MSARLSKHHWLLVGLAGIIGCQNAIQSIKPTSSGKAIPSPVGSSANPPASATPGPIGASPAPASPLPTIATSASPTPDAPLRPSPPFIDEQKKSLILGRLNTIARLSFEQSRAGIVSAVTPSTLISNNAGSAINTRGGGLISNNSGGLISNNSGGLISNNGGGLISNNSGGLSGNGLTGFRLAAADARISLEALADEQMDAQMIRETGERISVYHRINQPFHTYERRLEISPDGNILKQTIYRADGLHANGRPAIVNEARLDSDAGGNLRFRATLRTALDENGNVLQMAFESPPAILRFPEKGVELDINLYELDTRLTTGRFAYAYKRAGYTEEGTLSHVVTDEVGGVIINYTDALAPYGGESVVKSQSGEILYKKRVTVKDGTRIRQFDLGEGIEIRLAEGGKQITPGSLHLDGQEIGRVGMVILEDGTTVFDVAFLDAPTDVRRIGYGVLDDFDARLTQGRSNTPSPGAWRVETIAGAAAGFVDGDSRTARFETLRYLAPSRTQAGRFFAAESGNHRVLQIDQTSNGWTFKTIAGTGSRGDANGPGQQATLNEPFGIAVGPSDTLYVSELFGNRIRKLQPNADGSWQASTVAGNKSEGFKDGAGPDAMFRGPSGIALIESNLYVADQGNHRLRQIDLSQDPAIVSTVAGQATLGRDDGIGIAARITKPFSLSAENDHALLFRELDTGSLRRFDTRTRALSTIATGNGIIDGPLDMAHPSANAILATADGILVGSQTIRVVRPSGITTRAGNMAQGFNDGNATTARLVDIHGMVALGDGSFLFTDQHRFRRLIPPGK